MKVLNEYPGSHHYWEEYEQSDYFCPHCGKQDIWVEQGGGDYYVGVDYLCTACGGLSKLDHCCDNVKGANEMSKLEQLRSGVTKEPTTERGR